MCSPIPNPSRRSPGLADEVRAMDAELVEDRYCICDAKRHPVSLRVVRLVARPEPAVVDVDEPEL
jgi:hypothetical protein